jgi:molecular chaperone DnaK (HSP70)
VSVASEITKLRNQEITESSMGKPNPDRVVGIDLGTTNSLVAYMEGSTPIIIPGEDGLNLVPSVVAHDERGQFIV